MDDEREDDDNFDFPEDFDEIDKDDDEEDEDDEIDYIEDDDIYDEDE